MADVVAYTVKQRASDWAVVERRISGEGSNEWRNVCTSHHADDAERIAAALSAVEAWRRVTRLVGPPSVEGDNG